MRKTLNLHLIPKSEGNETVTETFPVGTSHDNRDVLENKIRLHTYMISRFMLLNPEGTVSFTWSS